MTTWARYEELRDRVRGGYDRHIVETKEESDATGLPIGTCVNTMRPPTTLASMDDMLEFYFLDAAVHSEAIQP